MVKRGTENNLFLALVSSIIGQQISTKAAITVRSRFKKLLGEISPENIRRTDLSSIQECGMPMRKAEYIKGIGEAVLSQSINLAALDNLEDRDVIKELTRLRGVGEWTAEMLLIHSLERPNILSYKDLGIRRGIKSLYQLDELSREDFKLYKDRYSPYASVASIYLWEISEGR